jgi:protein gp37
MGASSALINAHPVVEGRRRIELADLSTGKYWTKSHSITTGCYPVGGSDGPCAHCWAKALTERFPKVHGDFTPTFHADRLTIPDWRTPQVVFASITGDWLHPQCCGYDEIAQQIHAMSVRPRHVFLTCSKRTERLWDLDWVKIPGWWPRNVWAGATVWDDDSARATLDGLVKLPAKTWVSAEPLLGPIDFDPWVDTMGPTLDWVTVGAETGTGKRPADPEWFRRIIEVCQGAVRPVPVWVKAFPLSRGRITHQLSEMPAWARVRQATPEIDRILRRTP